MFWSDRGRRDGMISESPRIERASMAGSNRTTIVSSGLSLVPALAIDFKENFLFWADINKWVLVGCLVL